jgi:hypothetical protein
MYTITSEIEEQTGETILIKIESNGVFIILSNLIANAYRNEHSAIINLIESNRVKLLRFCDLLESDPNTAFVIFCDENDIYIHDIDEVNPPDGLISGN